MVEIKPNSKEALDQLERDVANIIAPLGYELVALDQSTAGGRKVVLYIDFLNNEVLPDGSSKNQAKSVGLDDCITVNRAVDEFFESTTLIDGHFTLEVSSPGVERPLRKPADFARFVGRKARLHTFRPLKPEETENDAYWQHHQKQKNFVGRLEGVSGSDQNGYKIRINVDGEVASVPLELVSKAHLEVDFSELETNTGKRK